MDPGEVGVTLEPAQEQWRGYQNSHSKVQQTREVPAYRSYYWGAWGGKFSERKSFKLRQVKSSFQIIK